MKPKFTEAEWKEFVFSKFDRNEWYAFVSGGFIQHAGKISGWREDGIVFLVGKGLKGYPAYGLWVDADYVKLLEEVKDLPRALESYNNAGKREYLKKLKKHE